MNVPSYSAAVTGSVARAWSIAFDSHIGNYIFQALEGTFSPYMPYYLTKYPDFVTLSLVLLLTDERGSKLGWENWDVGRWGN